MKIRKKQLAVATVLVLLVSGSCFLAQGKSEPAVQPKTAVKETADDAYPTLTQEDLDLLSKENILSGIKDREVKQGEDINLSKDVQYDANIVQDLQVQGNVDTSQAGTYDAGYLITINVPALQEKLQEQKVSFDLSGTTCKVQADIKVNVTQEDKKNTSAAKKGKETTNTQSKTSTVSSNNTAGTQSKPPTSSGKGTSSSSHVHDYQPHYAKRWVSNIVSVDDYETQTIYGAQFYTLGGYDASGQPIYYSNGPIYWFEEGFTMDDLKAIIHTGLANMDENGLYQGVYYGNYVNRTKTEKKKVGSHTEDHGHYETYIDYWQCACGAKKSA